MSLMPKLEQAYFADTKPSQEELLGFRKLFSKYENAALSEDQIVNLAQNARSQNLDLASELGQDYYQNKLAQQITNQRNNLGTSKYYLGDLGAMGGIDAATQYMASRLVLSGIRDISEIGEKTQKVLGPDYSNIPQAQQDYADWRKAGGYKGQNDGSIVNYNGKRYYVATTVVGYGVNFEGGGENYYDRVLIPINPTGEQEKILYNKRTGEQLKQGHDVGYAYANTSISPDDPNARYTIGGTFAGNNTGLNISMVNGIPFFYTTPGPSSAFISKESIGPVLAIASMMVPGLGIAIGSTITGALGVTVSSAVAGAIGTGVLTTIASGGDVKKGAIAAATSYFVPQIAGEIGDAAGNIFQSAAGKKLVENISAAALRTAALGGNANQIENAVLGATAGGMFDVVVNNLPGFSEITDSKTRAAIVASVQNALDAPGDLSNKFQAAALSGATTLGLSKIDIDGKKFTDLTPGQQSIVTTALGRELAGNPLTSSDIFKTVIDAVSKEVRADIQKERQPAKTVEAETRPVTKAEIAAESDAILASGEDALAGLSDEELTKGFSTEVTSDELGAILGSDKAADLGSPYEFEDIQDTEFLFPKPPSTDLKTGPISPFATLPRTEITGTLEDFFGLSGDQDLGDVLSGEDVTDLLSGGNGNDTVAGEPSVEGGAGNDLVVTDEDGSTITFNQDGEITKVTDVDNNIVYDADSLVGGGDNDMVTPLVPVETDAQRITREAAEAEALARSKYEDLYTDIFPDFDTYKAWKGDADAYRADQDIKRGKLAKELGFPSLLTFDFYKGDINLFHKDEADYLGFPDVGTYLKYKGDFKAYDDDQASAEGWPDASTRDEFNNDKARYAKHLKDERDLAEKGRAYEERLRQIAKFPDAATYVNFGGDYDAYLRSLAPPTGSTAGSASTAGSTSAATNTATDSAPTDAGTIDTTAGGAGNDTFVGEPSDDVLFGADDTLFGGAANDTLAGAVGNDTFVDGESADTLVGAVGNDITQGAEGDKAAGETQAGNIVITGEDGATVTLGLDGSVVDVTDSDGKEPGNSNDVQDVIDKVISNPVNIETVVGPEGTDTLPVSSDNLLGGGAGNDTLTGLDDVLSGGAGNDTLFGSAGSDTISETPAGGAGNDTLTNLDDILRGGEDTTGEFDTPPGGEDTPVGGLPAEGEEASEGGDGNDVLDGGEDTSEGGDVVDLKGFPDRATYDQFSGDYDAYLRSLEPVEPPYTPGEDAEKFQPPVTAEFPYTPGEDAEEFVPPYTPGEDAGEFVPPTGEAPTEPPYTPGEDAEEFVPKEEAPYTPGEDAEEFVAPVIPPYTPGEDAEEFAPTELPYTPGEDAEEFVTPPYTPGEDAEEFVEPPYTPGEDAAEFVTPETPYTPGEDATEFVPPYTPGEDAEEFITPEVPYTPGEDAEEFIPPYTPGEDAAEFEDKQPGFGFEVEGDQTGRPADVFVDDDGNTLIVEDDGTIHLTDPDGNPIDLTQPEVTPPQPPPSPPPPPPPQCPTGYVYNSNLKQCVPVKAQVPSNQSMDFLGLIGLMSMMQQPQQQQQQAPVKQIQETTSWEDLLSPYQDKPMTNEELLNMLRG